MGESATLPCQPPEGLPAPEVTWLREDSEVSNGSDASVGVAGELMLPGARPQDVGEYVCRARNMSGLRQASPTLLSVLGEHWV